MGLTERRERRGPNPARYRVVEFFLKKNGPRARISARPQPAPKGAGEAHCFGVVLA